jgi:hypothetical protein
MDKYYTVEFTVHNAASDAWQSKISDSSKDEITAKALFHSEAARLIPSTDFDFVCVLWRDNFGRVLDTDSKDTRVSPEPPEPVEE